MLQLADYFVKLGDGLQKQCGERPHSIRLEESKIDPSAYQTADSLELKKGVDVAIGKMEVIGTNILNYYSFKKHADKRITTLEELQETLINKELFKQKKKQMKLKLYEVRLEAYQY